RIFYAAGPGDVLGTYEHWLAGRDDPSQVSITYSGQFFDVCREIGAHALVISSSPRRANFRDGAMQIIHRPILFSRRSGLLYHLGQAWWGLRMSVAALRIGADVAIVSGDAHWLSLWLLPMFGVKLIPTLHCVFWPKS